MATFNEDEVRKLAELAHLTLSDEERASFSGQLDEILGYAERIQALDTEGVSPTSHALPRNRSRRRLGASRRRAKGKLESRERARGRARPRGRPVQSSQGVALTLGEQSATEITTKTKSGDLSAEETTRAFADRIEALDPTLGAFLDRMTEQALERARELDALPAVERGALHGLPVALKDIISVAGSRCTCGSRILENYVPVYNATVVDRLNDAGAVILGKTNMDEFAMGSSTENSAFHTTKNPWNLDCVPGGSSGGSAAAVAARLVPAALGTDTGGSIRQPASLCGVTGLKPTYGRVSRYGLVAFASSLDQIGPLTHSVEDAALLLEALAGDDANDATCATKPTPVYSRELDGDVKPLRLGIPKAATSEGVDSDVSAAFEAAVATFASLARRHRRSRASGNRARGCLLLPARDRRSELEPRSLRRCALRPQGFSRQSPPRDDGGYASPRLRAPRSSVASSSAPSFYPPATTTRIIKKHNECAA